MATTGILENIAIRGNSCAVPDNRVDNAAIVERFGVDGVEKFAKMTGVVSRCVALPGQTASDLSFVAAGKLLAKHFFDSCEERCPALARRQRFYSIENFGHRDCGGEQL